MPAVLITGAGRGFGRELARVFAADAWHVHALLRDPAAGEELKAELAGRGTIILADVGDPAAGAEVERALAEAGNPLELLINNAGHLKKLRGLAVTREEDLEDLFRVHVSGALRITRAALPWLRKARHPLVINISSRFGSLHRVAAGLWRGIYSYPIAKCAQNMLTVCLDQELRPEGIRVMALHPGRLKTEAAAADADVDPALAAVRLLDWLRTLPPGAPCRCYDLMEGGAIEW